MDILIDSNPISPGYEDAVFHNGPLTREFTTQPFIQTVAQRLKIRLLTFRGEWFLNTEYGPPYWQRILGQKPTKSALDQIFQEEILAENGVKEIVEFNSTFQTRAYSASFRVRVSTGEVTELINISPVN